MHAESTLIQHGSTDSFIGKCRRKISGEDKLYDFWRIINGNYYRMTMMDEGSGRQFSEEDVSPNVSKVNILRSEK